MRKMSSAFKQGLRVIEHGVLLKCLRSEIRHEISNPRFQEAEIGSLGCFKLVWDSPRSHDIVLRRQFDSGEEVVVSALLTDEPLEEVDTVFPRDVLAKICIKKPGISSILQFDCRVSEIRFGSYSETRFGTFDFDILKAVFIRSTRSSTYGDDLFRTLDPRLQDALKQYLISKGISEGLCNFLLCHLNKKGQDQYVNWLLKLESTLSNSLKQ